jgi:aspartate aminotransferase
MATVRRRLLLYGRPGCTLCDAALRELVAAAREVGRPVWVGRVNVEEDPRLLERYLTVLPVLAEVDGTVRLLAPWDPQALRRLLLEAYPQEGAGHTSPTMEGSGVEEAGAAKVGVALSRRAASIPGSPTIALDSRAKAMRAAGENVLNLAVGEPDLPPPAEALRAAAEALASAAKYTPPEGRPQLRQAVAEATTRETGVPVTPDMVLAGSGAKQVLYTLFHVLFDPGDQVLVPVPYWVSYPDQLRLAGVEPVFVPTRQEEGWHLTPEAVEAHWQPGVKGIVLNSPCNPTGAVLDVQALREILRVCARHDLWVISDEIYSRLVYDGGSRSPSALQVAQEAGFPVERLVLVDGASKKFAMTGFRVGWAVAHPEVVKAAGRLMSQVTSCVAGPSQVAAEVALRTGDEAVAVMRELYRHRRDRFLAGLAQVGLEAVPPQGAFYAWVSAAPLMGRQVEGIPLWSTQDVARMLLEVAKVATVPGEAFGVPGYLRMSFANEEEVLEEAVRRLAQVMDRAQPVASAAGGADRF